MLSPLFAIKIYKESLALDDSIQSAMREYLLNVFDKISTSHCLEKDGGKSTHQLARELHNNEIFQPLCNLIFNHASNYWNELGLSYFLEPKIVSMWANLHTNGSWTDVHSHLGHTLVGCYYLDYTENSGDLIFLNPLEYHYHSFPFSEEGKDLCMEYPAGIKQHNLVLFPGFLKHRTNTNNTNTSRISINFNIDFQAIPPVEYTF
jgi:uncharacterized protein (TIGR02466 family)